MQKTLINSNSNRLIVLVYGIIKMSRPAQLLAIILVYLYGSIVAWVNNANIDLNAFFLGLLVVLLVSASIHLTNEYADFETDALTQRTLFSGGSGALQDLGLNPRVALVSAWWALLIGSVLAVIGFIFGLLNSMALGILFLGAFLGWMYSLRPLALAWHGWGELDNALLGGVVLPLYAYLVQNSEFDPRAILIFIPFGMLVFVNLLATTWADREADQAVGKFTLATRWNTSRLRWIYLAVAAGTFTYLGIFNQLFPPPAGIASLLVIPLLVWGFFWYTRKHSPFPTVAAMAVYLLLQITAWGSVLLGR
jgi:1,4-dihydroxy-2-naphthoate octaprenyltransferase